MIKNILGVMFLLFFSDFLIAEDGFPLPDRIEFSNEYRVGLQEMATLFYLSDIEATANARGRKDHGMTALVFWGRSNTSLFSAYSFGVFDESRYKIDIKIRQRVSPGLPPGGVNVLQSAYLVSADDELIKVVSGIRDDDFVWSPRRFDVETASDGRRISIILTTADGEKRFVDSMSLYGSKSLSAIVGVLQRRGMFVDPE